MRLEDWEDLVILESQAQREALGFHGDGELPDWDFEEEGRVGYQEFVNQE